MRDALAPTVHAPVAGFHSSVWYATLTALLSAVDPPETSTPPSAMTVALDHTRSCDSAPIMAAVGVAPLRSSVCTCAFCRTDRMRPGWYITAGYQYPPAVSVSGVSLMLPLPAGLTKKVRPPIAATNTRPSGALHARG